MADNVNITPGTGTTIATDDVAGVHFQRVKLVDGTLDGSDGIPGDATNGLTVDVTRVQGVVQVGDNGATLSVDDGGASLTVDGTVAVSGTVATNIAQMNGVATTMGNGVAGTGVQRVTLASDSTGNVATIGTSVTPGTAATNLGKAEDAVHASADTGVSVLAVRRDTPAADAPYASDTGDYATPSVDSKGATYTAPRPVTATLANVTASATSVTVVAANNNRKAAILHNDSTATLYLKFGATASATSYTYKIDPGAHWEHPAGSIYVGAITGIWSAANGAARVTELVG